MKRWLAAGTAALTLGAGAFGVNAADKAQNPYIDRDTHYELPIQSDIPQGERVEIVKDRAAMTLKGWNDEYAITVEPQIPTAALGAVDRPFTTPANRPLMSKRMEYKSGTVTAFIEPRSENEFDIDFTLDSKPETNVFTYKITGAEDFDFFYQPALTQQEIDEGAERPENVVGSYAVYHKTKANHRVGSTNYATGKVAHIYRPKAIDANGAEVWAILDYQNGVLSVAVPQSFLDTAIYPVRVDPTFGYTSIGGTTNTTAFQDRISYRFTMGGDGGTIDSISAYLNAFDTQGDYRFGVFLQSTLAKQTETASRNVGTDDGGVTTFIWRTGNTLANPSLSASTDYVLTMGLDGRMDHAKYDSGTTNYGAITTTVYSTTVGSFSDPLVATFNNANKYSIYATYTAGGGGGGTTDIQSDLIIFQ